MSFSDVRKEIKTLQIKCLKENCKEQNLLDFISELKHNLDSYLGNR